MRWLVEYGAWFKKMMFWINHSLVSKEVWWTGPEQQAWRQMHMAANMGTCSSTTTNSTLFSKVTCITHLIDASEVKLIPRQKLEEFDRNVNLFYFRTKMKYEWGRQFDRNQAESTRVSVIKSENGGIIVKSLHYFTYLSKSEPGGKRAGYFKAGCRDINTTHKSVFTTTTYT